MEIINILFALSIIINFYLIMKLTARGNVLIEQQLKIRKLETTLRGWQRTHSKCIDSVCMENMLDAIIGDM